MEFFVENISLVLFLPAIICFIIGVNGLLSNRLDNTTLFSVSVASSFINVVFGIAVFIYSIINNLSVSSNFQWLSFENINFYLGTFLDKTSVSFLLVSVFLCFFVQILAFVKLRANKDFTRLLFYLNLFALGLNGVFVSSNIFQTYMFCEVIGVASYLLINFDFSNREHSKAGIKSFIYNRVGDLALLFCVLTIMYYAVVYNELSEVNALSYSNIGNVAASIGSLMSEPLFVLFNSLLILVVLMKFMQAFIYITFEPKPENPQDFIVLLQNSLIAFVGLFLCFRLNPFFFTLDKSIWWTIPVILGIVFVVILASKLFLPFCKLCAWFEKYVVELFINLSELVVRAFSYFSGRLQGGNFQSYLLYSIGGLAAILLFVLVFYELLIK